MDFLLKGDTSFGNLIILRRIPGSMNNRKQTSVFSNQSPAKSLLLWICGFPATPWTPDVTDPGAMEFFQSRERPWIWQQCEALALLFLDFLTCCDPCLHSSPSRDDTTALYWLLFRHSYQNSFWTTGYSSSACFSYSLDPIKVCGHIYWLICCFLRS